MAAQPAQLDPGDEPVLQPADFGMGRLFEQIREAVIVADAPGGRIRLWNPAAETLFGYTAGEALGLTVDALVPEELRGHHRGGLERFARSGHGHLIDTGRAVELPALHRNGERLWIELTLVPIADAQVRGTYALAIIRDVTERKRAEAERERRIREQVARLEAEAAQQRFALLAEASAILGASLEYDVSVREVLRLLVPRTATWCAVYLLENGGRLRPLASQHRDVRGQAALAELFRRYPVTPDSTHPVATVLRTGRSEFHPAIHDPSLLAVPDEPGHRELLARAGVASYMCVPLNARGRTIGTITLAAGPGKTYQAGDLTLVEDLATRIALAIDNARLVREAREAMQVREEFLASASHELRTPVTMIKAFAQMLEKRATRAGVLPAGELIEGLESIDESATRLATQIRQILDLARVQSGRPLELERRVTDLVELVRKAARTHEHLSGRHIIRVESPLSSLCGQWDPQRLELVVNNLLSNAVKFSDGGEIVVRVQRAERPDGPWAVLRVLDRGLGVPPDEQKYVFDRFYRASNVAGKVPGTGMGLASAREIVQQHGGAIAIESHPDDGTTVMLELPLEPGCE